MVTMLEQQFRIKYSEIMENFQCIEYDLKRIYSAMSADDFDENMDMLEFSNMGRRTICGNAKRNNVWRFYAILLAEGILFIFFKR